MADLNVGGPVSAALESELRTWVRKHGIVIWLDLDDHYAAFVARLAAARRADALPYAVHTFRGSHLALMLELADLTGGVEKTPLVVHLPGFNEERVKQSPLLELYAAGVRFRKALDTLVNEAAGGKVSPDQITAFTAQPDLTLAGADQWLASLLREEGGGLAAQLRAMRPTALLDDLLAGGFVAEQLRGHPQKGEPQADPKLDAVWERLSAWLGLAAPWRQMALPPASGPIRPEDVAFVAAGWALCVEYVDDLKRAPVSPVLAHAQGLPRAVVEHCREVAAHLRIHHPDFYRRSADETEALLADEVEAAQAEDLGKIDTFRFEEEKVLKAALAALAARQWQTAQEWAALRVGALDADTSFWLRADPTRQSAWQLVQTAADLGQAIRHAGDRLPTVGSLDAAVEAYVRQGAAVDRAHRHLEQRRVDLLYPQIAEFESLRTALDAMRHIWRRWADNWARDFNSLCRTQGFLPSAAYQQRTLFNQVVRPLTQSPGPTAYFVIDAFRYEMGEELYAQLAETPASTVQLKVRLAELPTITAVGMNLLAPVEVNGRLLPALSDSGTGAGAGIGMGAKVLGFSTGEFRVTDPESRKRAMHDRVGGGTAPWLSLDEVVNRESHSLKLAVAKARLVIVHSQEIDHAGEKEVGPAVFNHVMQKLRAAWHLLRDAGVRRFVFTSDHGFLLLDDSTATAQSHGRKIDPTRRHIFSPVDADHAGEVRVALADLGYDGVTGNLMFPDSTAVFDTGRQSGSFVHGGNSLQERVIPVLTVVHRAAAGGNALQFKVSATAQEGVAGMHCLEIKAEITSQQALAFAKPKEIELALRVLDLPDVQVEMIQTRGGAKLVGGVIQAALDEPFEIFFRLTGPVDARAVVEIHHPSAVADVQPCVPDARFAVTASASRAAVESLSPSQPSSPPASPGPGESWLDQLDDPGVRKLFAHLAAHGSVTEGEAATFLGSQRAVRRFSLYFEEYAQKAPFNVRIDMVGGVKRYVREGTYP